MGDDLLTSMSMLNSSIQNASNAYLTSKASKDDRKFAEAMYQRQVEDARANWMMQNEYNSPAAQRDRMIDAQINPAVAWSKGLSTDTGNSSEPEMASPLSWNKRIPAGLSQINPFEQLAAVLNAEKVKAEIQKMGADTRNVDQLTENAKVENALLEYSRQKEAAVAPYYGKHAYNDLMKKINENDILVNTAANLLKQGKLIEAEEACNKALKAWYDTQKEYKDLQMPYAVSDILSIIDERKSSAKANDAMSGYYTISSKDKLADYYRKIDDAIELYLDEHGDLKVDSAKLKEVKDMALKEAKNRIRQENQDYWNPFNYVGRALSAGATVTKKAN